MKTRRRGEKMRAIAEEACALVKRYKGARTRASTATAWCARSGSSPSSGRGSPLRFAEIKALFDPKNLMNPGKIVRPSKAGRPDSLPLQARLRDPS